MKFRDLFVPSWQHSNPEVRIKAIGEIKDAYVLKHIVDSDDDQLVRDAAADQLAQIPSQVQMTEKE